MPNVEIWHKKTGKKLSADEIDDLLYNSLNREELEWEVSKE